MVISKGPVIIYRLGGSEGFGGDHLIFRRTEGGISRNWEHKREGEESLKIFDGFRGVTTQICLNNASLTCKDIVGGSRKLSIVMRGDHFNKTTFKGGIG